MLDDHNATSWSSARLWIDRHGDDTTQEPQVVVACLELRPGPRSPGYEKESEVLWSIPMAMILQFSCSARLAGVLTQQFGTLTCTSNYKDRLCELPTLRWRVGEQRLLGQKSQSRLSAQLPTHCLFIQLLCWLVSTT
jgi:hypothetical protein